MFYSRNAHVPPAQLGAQVSASLHRRLCVPQPEEARGQVVGGGPGWQGAALLGDSFCSDVASEQGLYQK